MWVIFNICSFIVGRCSRHFCATGSKFRNANKKVRSVLSLIKVNWTESFNCVRNQPGGTWGEDALEQHYKVKLCDDWRWEEDGLFWGQGSRFIKYIIQALQKNSFSTHNTFWLRQALRVSLCRCPTVCLCGTNLFKALNLYLSPIGLSQVSVLSSLRYLHTS